MWNLIPKIQFLRVDFILQNGKSLTALFEILLMLTMHCSKHSCEHIVCMVHVHFYQLQWFKMGFYSFRNWLVIEEKKKNKIIMKNKQIENTRKEAFRSYRPAWRCRCQCRCTSKCSYYSLLCICMWVYYVCACVCCRCCCCYHLHLSVVHVFLFFLLLPISYRSFVLTATSALSSKYQHCNALWIDICGGEFVQFICCI